MGVSDVLPKILESSGRPIDLQDFQSGIPTSEAKCFSRTGNHHHREAPETSDSRPLRIGVDVHSWIYGAGHAFSDRLGDERHLTNYGRATLVQEQNEAQQAQKQGGLHHQQQQQQQQHPSEETIQDYVMACTNYIMKRLQTVQETTGAQVLVVLDGRSPPIKAKEVLKRRQLSKEHNRLRNDPTVALGSPDTIKIANNRRVIAFKRAGPGPYVSRILDSLVEALKATAVHDGPSLSFLVAPYEADSQLAYLARQRFIDLILTEDSDLIAHGAPCILYKSTAHISEGNTMGVLWQYSDIGALPLGRCSPEHPTQRSIKVTSASSIRLMDFSPVMMAVLFVLLGCDYTSGDKKKLKGIGLVTAHNIVRKAFLGDDKRGPGLDNGNNDTSPSVLSLVCN
jgi:5'-3' exonuclease